MPTAHSSIAESTLSFTNTLAYAGSGYAARVGADDGVAIDTSDLKSWAPRSWIGPVAVTALLIWAHARTVLRQRIIAPG